MRLPVFLSSTLSIPDEPPALPSAAGLVLSAPTEALLEDLRSLTLRMPASGSSAPIDGRGVEDDDEASEDAAPPADALPACPASSSTVPSCRVDESGLVCEKKDCLGRKRSLQTNLQASVFDGTARLFELDRAQPLQHLRQIASLQQRQPNKKMVSVCA